MLFKLFLLVKGIVQLNFLLITLSVEAPGIGRNSLSRWETPERLCGLENAAGASIDTVVSSKWVEFHFFSVSYPFNHGCSENGLFLFTITVILPTSTELSLMRAVWTFRRFSGYSNSNTRQTLHREMWKPWLSTPSDVRRRIFRSSYLFFFNFLFFFNQRLIQVNFGFPAL